MDWFYHEKNLEGKIKNNYREIGDIIADFKKDAYDKEFKAKLSKISSINKESCKQKIKILEDYYKKTNSFVEENNISSQSKFRSTILEEFCGYLFKDLPEIEKLNLDFFNKGIFAGLKIDSSGKMKIATKDVDFCIGKKFTIQLEKKELDLLIPVAAIECKTFVDNTMFNEAQFSAQKLKSGSPNVYVSILTEWNAIGRDSIPSQSPVDEIFVMRKNAHSNISVDLVYEFFENIKSVLCSKTLEELKLPGRLFNF